MLKACVEYFLPTFTTTDTEYIRRARLNAYAIFITMVFALFYISTSLVAGYYEGIYIMLGSSSGYLIILFLFKYGLDYLKAANLFGFVGALSIYGSIYFSGGFHSPVLPWITSTPIVLLLLAGKRSGFVWAGISVIAVTIFGLMEHYGWDFPTGYRPDRASYFGIACQTGLVLIVFFISIVFENIRVRAFTAVNDQKNILEKTLVELKDAQTQLIHSEKMASLGELTAGIAHEIQNPLNFVNNFSELNKELLEELKEAVEKGDQEDIKEIMEGLISNEEKVTHHGKRAEGIVQSMLQHSRTSTGDKESTDMNTLVDEYLRLTFHGLKAKDKSFDVSFHSELANELPSIDIVPQDIGRVLLNLFNNAFYAVNERAKKSDNDYSPQVWVSTTSTEDRIQISIRDNGIGIPEEIIDKIFQPFFTTKATGVGTGLGLSLSYDIVTAGHGGTLTATSEPGNTCFVIDLPLS